MGEIRNANKVLVGKPEAKKPSGRRGRGWEDNIKGSCEHGNEPSFSMKSREFLE
jgi:hypothetical protein